MRRRIKRTPANLVALALIVVILGAWLGVVLFPPGEHAHPVDASEAGSTSQQGHVHGGPPGSVADRIKAESASVQFCISASLEPFAGSLAQIREIGPDETSERFRRCLLDTMFDHASPETLTELETHRPHFADCFGALAGVDDSDKPAAVQSTLECVQKTTN